MVYRRVFLDFLFFVQSLDGNKTLTTKLYSCNISNWFSFEADRKNTFQPIRAHQLGKVLVYSTKLFTKPFNFTITIKWVSSERSRNNWKVGQFEKSFLSLVIVKGLQLMRWKDKLVPRILHLKDERSWELGWSKSNRHERLREDRWRNVINHVVCSSYYHCILFKLLLVLIVFKTFVMCPKVDT